MQLVEAGQPSLDDLAADRLPPGPEFDTNGASIADLLSHRSGLPETLTGPGGWESLTTDPLHSWTPEDVLATVGPERTPAGVDDEGYRTAALCFRDPSIVVVFLANAAEHDVDATAGSLVNAASTL